MKILANLQNGRITFYPTTTPKVTYSQVDTGEVNSKGSPIFERVQNNVIHTLTEDEETLLANREKGKMLILADAETLLLEDKELHTAHLVLVDRPLESIKASLRPERDRLLAASDWTQLNDTTLPEETLAAWSVYRQDLRDLTNVIDESGEVDFPEKP